MTTKYNPARTWTPENAVGIGGAYMCIYGMEGPGGYQFVGRTTQVWNHCHPRDAESFEPGTPWLLRYFDRISFYPVSAEELAGLRADMAAGRGEVDITDGEFSMREYSGFLAEHAESIAAFREQQASRVRGRTGRRGVAPGSSPARSRARRRAQPSVHLDVAPCSPSWTGSLSTPKAMMAAKTSRHKEVERKFDVVEATVSPSFDGLSAVARVERLPTQTLDAVYFDTAAHDLARNRITLRRRTGGPDAGWHLKLPAGADARTEVRMPLTDSDAVPDELRDVVLAIVRDRPLAPVARISTIRNVQMLYGADGAALAEFCDDQVTASAGPDDEQHWREWELELAEDCDDVDLLTRLGNRLLDAGAAPAGHGSKLARVLDAVRPAADDEPAAAPADPIHRAVAEQVAELVSWDRAVRADAYDSVHQMRVTTRKLRSLLKESEESFDLTDDAWVLDELRQLAAILGGGPRRRGARREVRDGARRTARRAGARPGARTPGRRCPAPI